MADREVDFLLVGGGMASAHCAAELRRRGAEGSILLVGREPEPPYERPPISKDYLRGEAGREDAYVNPPSWYEENGVELLIGRNVLSLDPEGGTAKVQGGEEVGFGQALLATGAMVNILRVEGAENEGIHYLRAFGNADAIRAEAQAEHVVLVGGSYIGCEVAASLAAQGKRCTILAMEEVALSRTFGDEAGRWFQERLEERGVAFHGGETLSAFEGDGRVRAVVTEGGLAVECDTVVVGAGVRPDAMLAQRAGLEVDPSGILCDSKLRTSAPGIYAAGDCCSYESVVHGRRIHVEHWDVAMQQGIKAAANMLGAEEDYDVVPYFFSDLADWASLEYVGPAYEWDREVWRGSREDGEFSVWYLQGDRVAGCLSVGRSEELSEARQMIAAGTPFS
jgi:3-phenylpropionate/trans-cinnamate dioxygenase ferredoxin reductase subunit